MTLYVGNKNCSCARCRSKSLTGAGILITVGVLFLVANFTSVGFDDTWPVILIVIGVFIYLGRTASTEGHVPQYYPAVPVAPPPAQPAPPQQHDSQVNP